MTNKSEPVARETAEPVGPGKPVEAQAVTQMGATFAERAGKKAPPASKQANTTFADRAKTSSKAVDEDSDGTENKAVAKKAAAKKS